MKEIKEIVLFSQGESSDSKTWSNIPYFLSNTLVSQGITLHSVSITENKFLEFIIDKIIFRILRHTFLKGTTYSYERSRFFSVRANKIMKNAINKYPNADCYLSTSFSFSPIQHTQKPCCMLCDWTYEYYLSHFVKRKPDFFEKRAIQRQDRLLLKVNTLVSLFPDVTNYMQTFYNSNQIHYIGNVINSDYTMFSKVHAQKKQSLQNILFIGLPKYKKGALSLIEAVSKLHDRYPLLSLDIIGMNSEEFSILPEYIICHGYLNKSDKKSKELYYNLLDNASIYINTSPNWAGFSSALEALYHGIPVITSPYTSFVSTFGNPISFGKYCISNQPTNIARHIEELITMSSIEYVALCENAHDSVSDFTWDIYTQRLLSLIMSTS